MTQSKHNLVTQPLETIPSNIPNVLLFYRQKQGKKLEVRLEVIGDFSESLQVELINQRGDLLVTPAMVNSPNWTSELSLEDIQEGSYLLQVLYQNCVLEETTFELLDESSLEETDEFYQGLELEDQVTEALEKGNYTEAMSLQERAAQCYQNNPELAARSWEELAEKLYEKQQTLLYKDALNKALEISNQFNNPNKIQTKIQTLRQKQGYSQTQLAFLIGVKTEVIQIWEMGEGFEDIKPFLELSQHLNCKIDDLAEIKENGQIDSKIKIIRENNTSYTESQIAFLIGIASQTIQMWEKGQGLQQLCKYFELAKSLKTQVSELIEWDDSISDSRLVEELSKVTES